jgi:hypothetical protein
MFEGPSNNVYNYKKHTLAQRTNDKLIPEIIHIKISCDRWIYTLQIKPFSCLKSNGNGHGLHKIT